MSVALVTGASGLVGSETVRFLDAQGLDVVGIDNNMRRYFFGPDGDVSWKTRELLEELPRYRHHDLDIRDAAGLDRVVSSLGRDIAIVVHAAAQPSHDWAAREPATDFSVNAVGTLNVLEATRRFAPDAAFIFTSTNKVYGDTPNALPLVERELRWELDPSHRWAEHGIDETMSIDQSTHSLFGASKVAADVLVQEYGRYFGMNTAVFRGGCLTGPAHSSAELHGFLGYLVKCCVTGRPYTVFGYKGKQVRDNIHANDLASAFWTYAQRPRPAAVYNIGGSRHSNCSILEAIGIIERLSGQAMNYRIVEEHRTGDHIWWVSDVRTFRREYPEWSYRHSLESMITEMVEAA
jgi:CDP-paratose 2-epimerase